MSTPRFRVALLAILVVALVLRVGLVALTHDYRPSYDAADYDNDAITLAEHGHYPPSLYAAPGSPTAFRPPGYPYLLAAVYKVTGQRWTAGRLVGAGLGVISVLLVALLAAEFWDRRTALAAGWLAALFPPLLFMASPLLAENLFVPLVLAACLAAVRFRELPSLRWAVAAGLACGLAALTRTNGAVLLVPVAIALLLASPRRGAGRLAAPALAVVVAALAVLPWTIRNAEAFGQLVPISTQSGVTLAGHFNPKSAADGPVQGANLLFSKVPGDAALFHHPGLNEAEIDRRLRGQARHFAWRHPGYMLESLRLDTIRMLDLGGDPAFTGPWETERDVTPARRLINRLGLGLVLLLTLIAIVARVPRRRLRAAPIWFWSVPVLMYLSTVFVVGNPRYRSAIDPFLLLAAGVAVAWLAERGRGGIRDPVQSPP